MASVRLRLIQRFIYTESDGKHVPNDLPYLNLCSQIPSKFFGWSTVSSCTRWELYIVFNLPWDQGKGKKCWFIELCHGELEWGDNQPALELSDEPLLEDLKSAKVGAVQQPSGAVAIDFQRWAATSTQFKGLPHGEERTSTLQGTPQKRNCGLLWWAIRALALW